MININNLGVNAQPKTLDGGRKDVTDPSSDKNVSGGASSAATNQGGVQLSDEAQKLEGIKKSIMSAPEVNEAKVERIKSEIANGQYKINFSNLADRMVDGFSNKG
jgi:negative regulator of flagellin synthesis FlgM